MLSRGTGPYYKNKLPITLHEDEALEHLEVVVNDPGLPIAGVVVDDGGHPIRTAWVSVDDGTDEPQSWGGPSLPSRHTEADGSFSLPDVPPGTYRITARVFGSQRFAAKRLLPGRVEAVSAGRNDVKVVLHAGTYLFGKVTKSTGAPEYNARVEAIGAGHDPLASVQSDPDGVFELVVPSSDVEAEPKSSRERVTLIVTGCPHGTFTHPEPGETVTLENVELDGPELTVRLPVPGH
jgi:hypothetical protein